MEKLKEILEKFFESEVLTKEVIGEIETMFELSVNEKVASVLEEKTAELQAQFDEKETALEEKAEADLATFKTELVDTFDAYLEKTTEEFIESHKVELESKVKVAAADAIMESVKKTLIDQHIELDESQIDVVSDLEQKLVESQEKLNVALNESIEKDKVVLMLEKEKILSGLTAGLADTEKERVESLVESVSFVGLEDFETKTKIIVEKVKALKPEKNDDLDENFTEKAEIDEFLPSYLR